MLCAFIITLSCKHLMFSGKPTSSMAAFQETTFAKNYLRLQSLISRFVEAKVEIGNIHMTQSLSDSTLTQLGLTTIGDRVRLLTKVMESPSTSTPAAKLP